MRHLIPAALVLALLGGTALAGQAPGPASAPDVPVGPRDRFYTSDQFSNTVSVIDPAANTLLGVIRLGVLDLAWRTAHPHRQLGGG